MPLTPLDKLLTLTGRLLPSWLVSPNCPFMFSPQHLTAPPSVNAQVWSKPAETALTPLVRPITSTGVDLLLKDPSPSWPLRLSPQHLIPPAVVSAQAWYAPVEMDETSLVRPITSTGDRLSVLVPL